MTMTEPEVTERHRQILTLVAEGMTNEQIARELNLSRDTVTRTLKQLYKRIGANRTSLVGSLGPVFTIWTASRPTT